MDRVCSLCRQAGDAILAVYHRPAAPNVAQKADASPLTEADLAAHRLLVGGLHGLLAGVPIVSEEDDASVAHRLPTGSFWLIDPLDGTKEFIARNGEFTVNVALVRDGEPVFGVVCAPVIDEMFIGARGLGAFRERGGARASIRVAERGDRPLRVVASRSHMTDATRSYLERLGPHTLVQAGSSLKFCRVAEGAADAYPRIGPTAEWDTAAAQAVLEAAGGVVHDLAGRTLRYGKPVNRNDGFVASAWPLPAVEPGA
ncbi:MAG: 3'(2'),5'-bisphosphate nucleotidase CysQ [Planctomycetota bacterium]